MMKENVVETAENYRPNPEIYERIDELAWLSGMMKDIYQQNHAIHDTLTGTNRVEVWHRCSYRLVRLTIIVIGCLYVSMYRPMRYTRVALAMSCFV